MNLMISDFMNMILVVSRWYRLIFVCCRFHIPVPNMFCWVHPYKAGLTSIEYAPAVPSHVNQFRLSLPILDICKWKNNFTYSSPIVTGWHSTLLCESPIVHQFFDDEILSNPCRKAIISGGKDMLPKWPRFPRGEAEPTWRCLGKAAWFPVQNKSSMAWFSTSNVQCKP